MLGKLRFAQHLKEYNLEDSYQEDKIIKNQTND
jgi:hypothetical protein